MGAIYIGAAFLVAAGIVACGSTEGTAPMQPNGGTGRSVSGSDDHDSTPPTDAGSSLAADATSTEQQQVPSVRRTVEAAGVSQYLDCAGSGSPTLMVVPGLDSGVDDWQDELGRLRELTRTCVYDRPGIGNSPARTGSTDVDAGQHADELSALMAASGERGPFVVLGHSYGGLVARAFVREHRGQVAGLLLAEGVSPNEPTNGSQWPEGGTEVDLARSYTATGDGPELGDLPLVVLSASDPSGDHLNGPRYPQSAEVTAEWVRDQRDAANLSTDSIAVIARSGHVLQQDNPAATTLAVSTLLAGIRSQTALGCAADWSAVDATCNTE